MAACDGLVVRVRPRAGRLSQEQAQGLAQLAQRWAHPVLELTNRANLQLRGVDPTHHAHLLGALKDLDLVDADAEREALRNVQVQPFWDAADPTPDLALQLEGLLARDDAPALPAKFGFAVDTGPVPCLREAYADIRLERHADGVLVYPDGALRGVVVPAADAADTALLLARWFLQAGGAPAGRGRMRALLQRIPLPASWQVAPRWQGAQSRPLPGWHQMGHLVGLVFGLLPAVTLSALATVGALRLTPWRCLLVEGDAPLPQLPELITKADDARLRVDACTGVPGCEQAAGPTRELALALAPLVPPGRRLHVSGCTKGCAHPRPAVTVVATRHGFDLIRHGTAAGVPDHTGLDHDTLVHQLQQSFSHAAHL
ncbi:CobG: precorrin-3B synthase [Tepidimonas thermarum]|uniref:CobG: precorrin-3B synthase n=1 Tax=Tepidimonas thermarum TaxID=335431 RepID=A0A554WXV9_9BURK|nr:precorrin-3B synthase [Tepidimonas thermarum]TSE28391.1 CobG: precorrin-3B synthase [Tepidimonas thermarum]